MGLQIKIKIREVSKGSSQNLASIEGRQRGETSSEKARQVTMETRRMTWRQPEPVRRRTHGHTLGSKGRAPKQNDG